MIDLYKLRHLAKEATTRGSWWGGTQGGDYHVVGVYLGDSGVLRGLNSREDADYFAAVDPDTILELLIEIERLGNIIRSLQ